jgi:hypothetical protein
MKSFQALSGLESSGFDFRFVITRSEIWMKIWDVDCRWNRPLGGAIILDSTSVKSFGVTTKMA